MTAGAMEGLRRGDKQLIAEATGLSIETVKKTVRGTRNNQAVKIAVNALIKNREKFINTVRAKR